VEGLSVEAGVHAKRRSEKIEARMNCFIVNLRSVHTL